MHLHHISCSTPHPATDTAAAGSPLQCSQLPHQQRQQQQQAPQLLQDAWHGLWREVALRAGSASPACFSHTLTPCGGRFLALVGGWPTAQHNQLHLFDTVRGRAWG